MKYEIHFADVSQSLANWGFRPTQFLYAAKISGSDNSTEDIIATLILNQEVNS